MQSFSASLPAKALALLLSMNIAAMGYAGSGWLDAEPGLPDNHDFAIFAVPGGYYNVANANLTIRRVDMVVDTPVVAQGISAVYNSASGAWLWNFQVTYDGTEFIDPTGAVYDVSSVPTGAAIPGSVWVKVDGTTIATRGGLEHHFDGSGRLDYVAWRQLPYPRVDYTWSSDLVKVAQCVSELMPAEFCPVLFTIELSGGDPIRAVNERTGDEALYRYDLLGRLELAQHPFELANGLPGTRYEYEPAGTLLTAITNSEGERIEYDWEAGRRISSIQRIGEGDPAYLFTYTVSETVPKSYGTVVTNPLGGVTKYYIDGERRLTEILRLPQNGPDEQTLLEWTGARPHQVQGFDGATTHFTYLDDDIATVTQPSGNVIRITYAPDANHFEEPFIRPIEYAEDDEGLIVEFTFESGLPTGSTNGDGDTVTTAYRATAVESVTSASGATSTFSVYGQHGHWVEAETPNFPFPVRRRFDAVGNLEVPGAGLQEGGVLGRSFDQNRLLRSLRVAAADESGSVVPGSDEDVLITRRSDGQVLRIERPRGADHEFQYDALGRLHRIREAVDGQWQETVVERNGLGLTTAIERPNGMRQEIEYDEYGRVSGRSAYRDGSLEGYVEIHWESNQIVAAYDSVRDTWETIAYDAAGRRKTLSYSKYGEFLVFEYDLRSRVTKQTYHFAGESREIGFEWYLDDRQKRVYTTGATGEETLLEFTREGGRQRFVSYGNGLIREHLYADGGLLAGFHTVNTLGTPDPSDDQVVEDTTVTRRVAADRLRVATTTWTPLHETSEEYWLQLGGNLQDPDRLIGPRVFAWSGGGETRRYAYDALSNRVDDSAGNVLTYDAEGNRLLSADVDGASHTYSYDEAGFVTSRDGIPLDWTATGHLARLGPEAAPLIELEWNLAGTPVWIDVLGERRDFALFAGQVEYDPNTGEMGLIHLGSVSLPLVGDDRVYRHADFRGNTGFLTDENGDVITQYRYHTFGIDETFGAVGFGAGDPAGFAGGVQLGDGLVLLGVRVLDSHVGRFLSPDPRMHDLNQYSYALGNPVFFWDPDGFHEITNGDIQAAAWDAAGYALYVIAAAVAAGVVAATATGWVAGLAVFGLLSAAAAALCFYVSAELKLIDLIKTKSKASGKTRKELHIEAEGLRQATLPPVAPGFGAFGFRGGSGSFGFPGFKWSLGGVPTFACCPCVCCDSPTTTVAQPDKTVWMLFLVAVTMLLAGGMVSRRRSGLAGRPRAV